MVVNKTSSKPLIFFFFVYHEGHEVHGEEKKGFVSRSVLRKGLQKERLYIYGSIYQIKGQDADRHKAGRSTGFRF